MKHGALLFRWDHHSQMCHNTPLNKAGCSTHFHHMPWADRLVLLARSAHTHSCTIEELILALYVVGS